MDRLKVEGVREGWIPNLRAAGVTAVSSPRTPAFMQGCRIHPPLSDINGLRA